MNMLVGFYFSPFSDPFFAVYWANGKGATAGDSITWNKVFSVKTNGDVEVAGSIKSGGSLLPKRDNTYDIGSSSLRFKDGYFAGTVYTGDLKFANDWVMTERDDNGNVIEGIRILNRKGEEIFKITEDGLWFKGKKIA